MKYIWKNLKWILALSLFFCAVRDQGAAHEAGDIVTVFLEDQLPDDTRAEEICEQEAEQENSALLCFWAEQEDTRITCQETGQSSSVNLVTTRGNSDLVMERTVFLKWQTQGCMIDRRTAEELFGTGEASGQVLFCGEERYTVSGTFDSAERLMIRRTAEQDKTQFSNLSLRFSDTNNIKAKTEQLLMRYGLSGNSVDFVFYDALAGNLLLLFPAVIMIKLAGALLRSRKKQGRAAVILAVGISLFLISRRISIPSDMIPSQWSDFAFWENWGESQKENLLRILGTSLGEAQLSLLIQLGRSMICSLLAVGLAMV